MRKYIILSGLVFLPAVISAQGKIRYTYFLYDGEVRPHAVAEVENTDGQIPSDALNTSFNDF